MFKPNYDDLEDVIHYEVDMFDTVSRDVDEALNLELNNFLEVQEREFPDFTIDSLFLDQAYPGGNHYVRYRNVSGTCIDTFDIRYNCTERATGNPFTVDVNIRFSDTDIQLEGGYDDSTVVYFFRGPNVTHVNTKGTSDELGQQAFEAIKRGWIEDEPVTAASASLPGYRELANNAGY